MKEIWAGVQEAFRLIFILDADLIEITLRSLEVSLTALMIASALALPFGTWLAIRRFRYRRFTIAVLNALMGLPPVVVGLVVYLLLSRSGPFGVMGLLFTADCHDHRSGDRYHASDRLHHPSSYARAVVGISRLADLPKHNQTPESSGFDLGWPTHLDDCGLSRFWPGDWRGGRYHDRRWQY